MANVMPRTAPAAATASPPRAPAPADAAARRRRIIDFVGAFSIETTPREAARIKDYRDHLAAGTTVYVAHVPGSSYDNVIALCKRLRREGFEPVPHVTARSITHRERLDESLRRLTAEAGVAQVLIIGGDYRSPVGPFDGTLDVLATGLFERHGIRRIGIAAHPEGSRVIGGAVLRDALLRKNEYARTSAAEFYVVTQFGFDAGAVVAWERSVRGSANTLPIRVGVAGLANLRTLIRHAIGCGIGPSMRALTQRASGLAHVVAMPTPSELVAALAEVRAVDAASDIRGLHFFPFGSLVRTSLWLKAIAEGRFHLTAGGFEVEGAAGRR